MFISKLQFGATVAVALGLIVGLIWSARENSQLRREMVRDIAVSPRTAELRRQVDAETHRVAVVEARLTALLKSADATSLKARTALLAARGSIDARDALNQTLERAKQLIQEGKLQEALDVYLELYREIEPTGANSSESQSLMSAIRSLGRRFPSAMAALGELRDVAMAQHQANPENRSFISEIALLNRHLKQDDRTVTLYDSLAPNHVDRRGLAMIAFDGFVEARRYNDALIGKSFGDMLVPVESGAKQLAQQTGELQAGRRKSIIEVTVVYIEVLTGAGRLDDAQRLTEKLLQFDNSDATRSELKQHLERAQAPK